MRLCGQSECPFPSGAFNRTNGRISSMVTQALKGRKALVTGASRGIGRGIALELGRRGADVVVNYRRDAAAAGEVVAELEGMGRRALTAEAALGEPGSAERLAELTLGEFENLDIVVLNAGIASRGNSVADTDPSELGRVLATHAVSAHRLIQLLLPSLRSNQRSDVVAISSSELTFMRANGAPYNMAKAALEALAFTLAHEEAQNGLRVNVVAPGLVATDMGSKLVKAKLGIDEIGSLDSRQPLGRVCSPADVAGVVAFLVSQDAAMVTAQRVVVDGGADASPTGEASPG